MFLICSSLATGVAEIPHCCKSIETLGKLGREPAKSSQDCGTPQKRKLSVTKDPLGKYL